MVILSSIGRSKAISSDTAPLKMTEALTEGLPLPPCHLSEEEQLIELSQAYNRIQRILPPPFSEKEVRALEQRFKNRFPLLLRHYLLNITRELIIRSEYDERRIYSNWSILEIAEFSWKELWEEVYEDSKWCLPDSMMGEESRRWILHCNMLERRCSRICISV